MALTRIGPLLASLVLLGCPPEQAAGPGLNVSGERAPTNAVAMATAHRAQAEYATHAHSPLGSFGRRVWQEELERLLRPLRASRWAAQLPAALTGAGVARWETALDEAWKTVDPETARAGAETVAAEAAAAREALKQLTQAEAEPVDAVAVGVVVGDLL